MGFKKFKADVAVAAQKAGGGGVSGVLSVTNGDSDGEVVVKYSHESLQEDIRIQALAQDVSEYPDGNKFMLWTDDNNPPPPVVAAIQAAQDYLFGVSVYEMVNELASRLDKEITRSDAGEVDSLSEDEEEDEDNDYDAAFDADYPSDGEEFGLPSSPSRPLHQPSRPTDCEKPLLQRIRRDLRRAKQAGYKVGFLDAFGKTSASGIVSISIRVDKLALSDEAMEAWDVKHSEYIVLLLRFERNYDYLERVIDKAAVYAEVKFRIGKCNKYKPSPSQAIGAFSESNGPLITESSGPDTRHSAQGDATFEKLFVSNSLDSFLCESFVSLLKIRETEGIDWEEANEHLLARIGHFAEDHRHPGPPGTNVGQTAKVPNLAVEKDFVLGPDHLREKGFTNERSLPLVAMQFAMRYFVKCTEYCLRCHRRLEKRFEALRPYVCSDPLCLFQYMAMGLGPSIEHEILTEPYVVDLLVSLCYAAVEPCQYNDPVAGATSTGTKLPIRSLPVGLRLRVPDLFDFASKPLKARVIMNNTRLIFEDEGAKAFGERLAPGRWLAFRKSSQSLTQHARIQEVDPPTNSVIIELMGESRAYLGTVYYTHGLGTSTADFSSSGPANDGKSQGLADIADVFPYDTDFDSMDDIRQGAAIRHILDTLPSILEIEEWLTSHPHSPLRSMKRISPAAASLLQWIVSSNRSCIFQVDRSRTVTHPQTGICESKPPGPRLQGTRPPEDPGVAGRGRNREHERILGMDGWIQFRFAQGSPDKELRFNRALQEAAASNPNQRNPTIFAWHGSKLANWHSIVRTGLDYKDMAFGRAFGNGVYFSPHHDTSIGYAGQGQPWPNSDLQITRCLSLNEIINAPDKFVSRSPHYVVSQLDWHQCRYLFAQTHTGSVADVTTTAKPVADSQAFYPQAPGLEIYGHCGVPLQIPLSAIPLRTIDAAAAIPSINAKRSAQLLEDSDGDDGEDLDSLYTDDEFASSDGPPNKKPASRGSSIDMPRAGITCARPWSRMRQNELTDLYGGGAGPPTPSSISIDRALTNFEPGSHDLSTLPRLQPPSFATDAGTKSLSRELVRLQTVQSQTRLHELGWYMDFDNVSNLFQWIVELHSFDPSLPLAHDMKAAGITSIILELRFGPDHPFSPPFVRIIRPRFLPFLQGGGGHVTAGGAMCMELLTSSGWSPASSMESVLLQVRMALCNPEPKPARLHPDVLRCGLTRGGDYQVGEAIDAFVRAANAHGWEVPDNLHVTARGV